MVTARTNIFKLLFLLLHILDLIYLHNLIRKQFPIMDDNTAACNLEMMITEEETPIKINVSRRILLDLFEPGVYLLD